MYQCISSLQKKCYKAIALIILICLPEICLASEYNYESHKCIDAISYYESKYNIPKDLLHSIAIVESGRWDVAAKRISPWPWAVNVQGEAHYFPTKAMAVNFVKMKMNLGITNIDVGCNQISMLHHSHKFPSLDHAFDPYNNSRYAAEFLQSNYNESKNWIIATGSYHSKTKELANPYIHKVHKTWRHLKERSQSPINPTSTTVPAHDISKKKSNKIKSTHKRRQQPSVIFVKR